MTSTLPNPPHAASHAPGGADALDLALQCGKGASLPVQPDPLWPTGSLFYRTSNSQLYRSYGSGWDPVQATPTASTQTSAGTQAARPANGPSAGFVYFATDTGQVSRWDGSAWVVVGYAVTDAPATASEQALYFDFTDTTTFARGWTVVAGAAPTVSGGVATPASGSEHVLIRAAESIGDVEFVWRVNANATSGGSWSAIAKYIDNNNYLLFRWTPNVGSFDVFYKDGGAFTQVIGTATLTATPGTPYWVLASIIGNTMRIELWTTDPAAGGSPNQDATHVLSGSQATKFGAGVRGKGGLRHNSPATHSLEELIIRPLGRPPRQRDVQVFTSSGTWTKPSGAAADPKATTTLHVVGSGAAGGSGARVASGTSCSGGAGGGPAGYSTATMPTSDIAATATVTIGAAGTAGTPPATDNTAGVNGGNGSTCLFDDGAGVKLVGRGAFGGQGGQIAAGAAGGVSSGGLFTGGSGGASGNNGAAGFNSGDQTVPSASPGAAGGGISTAPASFAGGNRSYVRSTDTGGGGSGAAGGSNGAGAVTTGWPFYGNTYRLGTAGGGGGSHTGGNGGNAGASAGYGAGGSGGGSCLNGSTPGAGANGTPGIVIVVTEWGG